MEVTEQQIAAFVGQYLWPMFRVASFMMIVPIFSGNMVTARLRVLLALAISVLIAPTLETLPPVDPVSLESAMITLQQVLIGLALGYAVTVLFQLVVTAGQAIAMQMGLGFASMVDPANGLTVTALSQFYLMLITIVFLALNGHLVMLEVLVESFRVMPISDQGFSPEGWWYLASRVSWLFAGALSIALPTLTALLIVNISFGVMTRAAPQMNIFSLGFPLGVIFGLYVFWVTLGDFLTIFMDFTEQNFLFMRELMQLQP